MRAKIGIAFLSISVLISFGLSSNQAFAGGFDVPFPTSCQDCDELEEVFLEFCTVGVGSQSQITECNQLFQSIQLCRPTFCRAVGGDMIQMETTSILAAGAQYTAAWMIPVLVSAIGIGIVIARKF